jgi:signal transduction histidine kinase
MIDLSLFGKLLDRGIFSYKTYSYSGLNGVEFGGVAIIFLFSPNDSKKLEEAVDYFSDEKEGKKFIVIVSSLAAFKLLGGRTKELCSDHLVFPSDNTSVIKRLELYKRFLTCNRQNGGDDELHEMQTRILELEEQNVAKDKFFAIIAHDLKNPFTGFLGFSEYIAKYYDEITKDDLGDFSLRMYESAQHVYNLIENLLAWSKLRTGNMEFDPVPFDMEETIKRVLKLCEPMIKKKEINLVDSSGKKLEVFADANMIDTVFRNVMTNAIKFTPKGGVVHIGYQLEEEYIIIFVADSGIGIPEERQKKMFRLGYRVSRDGTDGESGSGLGLILSKEFMLKNGGDIFFESNEKNGSKFYLKIPRLV